MTAPFPDPEVWSTDQRRRAEALVLVRYLWPSLTVGASAIAIARWVTNGSAP
jgi:hypothetical protein